MSKNLPKKLELKAELIRHLDTAIQMAEQTKPSSVMNALLIAVDLHRLERDQEPFAGIEFWNERMAGFEVS